MINFFLTFLICLSWAFAPKAEAYPNFIGHGYNSCITCHYNPFGNGPINDYGRAVSGAAIASRMFYDENKSEESIAKETGFFFKEPTSKHFRPFVGYRSLMIRRSLGQDSAQSDFIQMQADASMVAKFGAKDQVYMEGTIGYAPTPLAVQNSKKPNDVKNYRSREYYIAWRPEKSWGIYAGLMDKPFGVRVVEHTAYSRTTPQLTMNDQSNGVIFHYANLLFEGGVNAFVGNLVQTKALRMAGFSGTFEYTLLEKNRIGMSLMSEQNDFLKLNAKAVHIRSGLSAGSSVILELGQVSKTQKDTSETKKEYYANFQNHIEIARGAYVLNSIEYYKNSALYNSKVRFGPGLQFFPMSKTEFRIDLFNTRTLDKASSTPDRWDITGQVHLWL